MKTSGIGLLIVILSSFIAFAQGYALDVSCRDPEWKEMVINATVNARAKATKAKKRLTDIRTKLAKHEVIDKMEHQEIIKAIQLIFGVEQVTLKILDDLRRPFSNIKEKPPYQEPLKQGDLPPQFPYNDMPSDDIWEFCNLDRFDYKDEGGNLIWQDLPGHQVYDIAMDMRFDQALFEECDMGDMGNAQPDPSRHIYGFLITRNVAHPHYQNLLQFCPWYLKQVKYSEPPSFENIRLDPVTSYYPPNSPNAGKALIRALSRWNGRIRQIDHLLTMGQRTLQLLVQKSNPIPRTASDGKIGQLSGYPATWDGVMAVRATGKSLEHASSYSMLALVIEVIAISEFTVNERGNLVLQQYN